MGAACSSGISPDPAGQAPAAAKPEGAVPVGTPLPADGSVKKATPGPGIPTTAPGASAPGAVLTKVSTRKASLPRPLSAGPRPHVLPRETGNIRTKYAAGTQLGKGHFGIVHLAVDKNTGQKFACKTINKAQLKDNAEVSELKNEIAVFDYVAGHPNIIQLRDVYEDDASLHLVMDLCDGGSLIDMLHREVPLPEPKAAAVFRAIIKSVMHCHQIGVIHRDLKPENFLLTSDGVVKLADFGLSTFFKAGVALEERVGSPYFVAPEVLKRSYGPSADLWSCGVILAIMLSGEFPFGGDSIEAIFKRVANEKPLFSPAAWKAVSKNAVDVVRRLLDKSPEGRLTGQAVLNHPWMLTYAAGSRKGGVKDDRASVSGVSAPTAVGAPPSFAPHRSVSMPGLAPMATHRPHALKSTAPSAGIPGLDRIVDDDDPGGMEGNAGDAAAVVAESDAGVGAPALVPLSLRTVPVSRPPSTTETVSADDSGSAAGRDSLSSLLAPMDPAGRPAVLRTKSMKRPVAGTLIRTVTPVSPRVFTSPVDPAVRGRLHVFVETFKSGLEPQYMRLLQAPNAAAVAAETEAFTKSLLKMEAVFTESGSPDGPFFLGQEPSLAEASTAPTFMRMCITLPVFRNIALAPFARAAGAERLATWLEAVSRDPTNVCEVPMLPAEYVVQMARKMHVGFEGGGGDAVLPVSGGGRGLAGDLASTTATGGGRTLVRTESNAGSKTSR